MQFDSPDPIRDVSELTAQVVVDQKERTPNPRLLQSAATQEIPSGRHALLTKSQHTIVEYKSKIAITGNDVHFFSNSQRGSRLDLDRGVFCGKTDDSAIWIVSEDWRGLMLADGLLADVEDGAIGGRSADDCGQEGECG